MAFQSQCKNRVLGKNMAQVMASRQKMKVCFICSRPFNRRKGRGKAIQVPNLIGRYICECCTDK